MNTMRPIFWVLLGALIMFIVLKIASSVSRPASATTDRLKALVKTPQAGNLIKSNEFRELIKTDEFKSFVKTLANDQLVTLSKSLVS